MVSPETQLMMMGPLSNLSPSGSSTNAKAKRQGSSSAAKGGGIRPLKRLYADVVGPLPATKHPGPAAAFAKFVLFLVFSAAHIVCKDRQGMSGASLQKNGVLVLHSPGKPPPMHIHTAQCMYKACWSCPQTRRLAVRQTEASRLT